MQRLGAADDGETLRSAVKAVPTVPAIINRIVVIGDTGCRIEGSAAQNCGDTAQWPFAVIAKDAAGRKPDLVIHVGDYYYREDPCPAGNRGCADSPHGDNWGAWRADFFEPAAPLLAAAPWVMVRGNHEICGAPRQGLGPAFGPARGPARMHADQSPPYHLHAGGLDLMLFDDSAADDLQARSGQGCRLCGAAGRNCSCRRAGAFLALLMHRPVSGARAKARKAAKNVNQTFIEAAIKGHVPPGLDLVLSGHLHDFISYEFGPERPAQLIVGDSGDTMLDLAGVPLTGAQIDGMKTVKGFALERFGLFVMERNGEGLERHALCPGRQNRAGAVHHRWARSRLSQLRGVARYCPRIAKAAISMTRHILRGEAWRSSARRPNLL